MILLSVEHWPTLLMVYVDEETNTWFQPSKIVIPPIPLHTYTLEELLKEWNPTRRQ